MLCKNEEEAGNPQYACVHLDAYEANVMSSEEIEVERRAYESSNESHLFHQEVLARFDAIDAEEAPFNAKVMQLEDGKSDMTEIDRKTMQDKTRLNVVCDIGARGNAATWFWVESPVDHNPVIVEYHDKWNGIKELLHYCATNFQEYQVVRVTLPSDVLQPSLEDGNTRLHVLQEYLNEHGYSNKVKINVLPKTKDKNQLWQMGISKFNTLRWHRDGKGVFEGLQKLSQIKFKRDAKTGWVKFGDVILDGTQHSGDALLYLFADLNEAKDLLSQTYRQLKGIVPGNSNFHNMNYRGDKRDKRYRW